MPLEITVRRITEKTNYEELFRVDMTYKNVITQSEEK
jgi:hypothetical protein